jgi:hypothetical protein
MVVLNTIGCTVYVAVQALEGDQFRGEVVTGVAADRLVWEAGML